MTKQLINNNKNNNSTPVTQLVQIQEVTKMISEENYISSVSKS